MEVDSLILSLKYGNMPLNHLNPASHDVWDKTRLCFKRMTRIHLLENDLLLSSIFSCPNSWHSSFQPNKPYSTVWPTKNSFPLGFSNHAGSTIVWVPLPSKRKTLPTARYTTHSKEKELEYFLHNGLKLFMLE